jgi:DNA-binding transcriptional regulator YiaG
LLPQRKKSRILVDFSRENEARTNACGMASAARSPLEPIHGGAVNRVLNREKLSAMKPFERISNPREIRRKLHLNQQEFWSRIGVTQSGGSRYESGRGMPKPVRELLRLVHIEGLKLDRVTGGDLNVVCYLKTSNPRLYRNLRKAAAKGNGRKK